VGVSPTFFQIHFRSWQPQQFALKTAEIRCQLEKAGYKIGPYDLQLSGQALSLDLTIVTHNTREFKQVTGLRLEDWEAEEPKHDPVEN
jgi:predicted nucleic acid-binding protein